MTLKDILGPKGVLAKNLLHYEYRSGQIDMAIAIQRVINSGGQLLVEAGTGTGKTLAYLIPAIYSGQKVVISTGTKNLQEQLYNKDVPFLTKHLDVKFKVCYMKGRNNYLCRRRWTGFAQQPLFTQLDEAKLFDKLQEWVPFTHTGDRSELEFLPDNSSIWQDICSKSELCLNQKCSFFDNCFITRMKQEALQADIIIVNHHLFFADLALKSTSYGEVIPSYYAVIFDEAHQIEETATTYFGMDISNYQVDELIRDTEREILVARQMQANLGPQIEKLKAINQKFFDSFFSFGDKYRLTRKQLDSKQSLGKDLINALELLAASLEGLEKPGDELFACARRAKELAGKVEYLFIPLESAHVYWGETRGRGCFVHVSPLDIAAELEEKLYQGTEAVIFTSATLTTQNNFSFYKQRLGLHAPEELIVPEHFDYKRQVAIYLPKLLPNPNSSNFVPAIIEEISQIVAKTEGRALILFTSHQQLNAVYKGLRLKLSYTILRQGEQPKSVLLKRFQEDLQSVLLATSSFWQGVDVPGEALSCLVIVKLPFAVPSEPILEARLEHIEKIGGNPFWEYQLPSATILLRQGFGRLIRNQADKGVLVILDKRISCKSYGKVFWESLPDCKKIDDIKEIEGFLGRNEQRFKSNCSHLKEYTDYVPKVGSNYS